MLFIQSLRNGSSWTITTWRNCWTSPFPSTGDLWPRSSEVPQFLFSDLFRLFFHPNKLYWNRLIVTEAAQCGAWSTWAAANKRSRNARISHSENTLNSDAVQFFIHVLSTDPYNEFNMQEELYAHFEQLLSTAEKPLKLTAQNFAVKVKIQSIWWS